MSLSEAKLQMHQFQASCYLGSLKKSQAAPPVEVVSMDLLAKELEGGTYWHWAHWTESLELSGRPSTRCEFERLCQGVSMDSE